MLISLFDVISELRFFGEVLGRGEDAHGVALTSASLYDPLNAIRQIALGTKVGSNGTLTVRALKPESVDCQLGSNAYYLVVCPASTPEGIVTELDPETMRPFGLQSHRH